MPRERMAFIKCTTIDMLYFQLTWLHLKASNSKHSESLKLISECVEHCFPVWTFRVVASKCVQTFPFIPRTDFIKKNGMKNVNVLDCLQINSKNFHFSELGFESALKSHHCANQKRKQLNFERKVKFMWSAWTCVSIRHRNNCNYISIFHFSYTINM